MVAGQDNKGRGETVRINMHYDALEQEDAELMVDMYSDLDSAMGKGDQVGFASRATVYLLGRFKESLTKSAHWKHEVSVRGQVSKYHLEQRCHRH
jgi:hypothetical protein